MQGSLRVELKMTVKGAIALWSHDLRHQVEQNDACKLQRIDAASVSIHTSSSTIGDKRG